MQQYVVLEKNTFVHCPETRRRNFRRAHSSDCLLGLEEPDTAMKSPKEREMYHITCVEDYADKETEENEFFFDAAESPICIQTPRKFGYPACRLSISSVSTLSGSNGEPERYSVRSFSSFNLDSVQETPNGSFNSAVLSRKDSDLESRSSVETISIGQRNSGSLRNSNSGSLMHSPSGSFDNHMSLQKQGSCNRLSVQSLSNLCISTTPQASPRSTDIATPIAMDPTNSPLDQYAVENAKPESEWTSIMVRHIPCRYTQEHFFQELSEFGLPFNFLYLPPARRCTGNLGYAFINFVRAEDAEYFLRIFQGHAFKMHPNSKKRAQVLYAKLQGFKQNVEFYENVQVKRHSPYVDYTWGYN
jgi:hypothetical protein